MYSQHVSLHNKSTGSESLKQLHMLCVFSLTPNHANTAQFLSQKKTPQHVSLCTAEENFTYLCSPPHCQHTHTHTHIHTHTHTHTHTPIQSLPLPTGSTLCRGGVPRGQWSPSLNPWVRESGVCSAGHQYCSSTFSPYYGATTLHRSNSIAQNNYFYVAKPFVNVKYLVCSILS